EGDWGLRVGGKEGGAGVQGVIVGEVDELLLAVLDEDLGDRKSRTRGGYRRTRGSPGQAHAEKLDPAPRDAECGNELCAGAERRLGKGREVPAVDPDREEAQGVQVGRPRALGVRVRLEHDRGVGDERRKISEEER